MPNLLINEINNVSLGEMTELPKEEQKMLLGGEMCIANSQAFSPGYVMSAPGGTLTCRSNGTWLYLKD
jgi:hypothetical protein